jgi:N-acetylglutamate synthase-like GNAT family acetyltransferase
MFREATAEDFHAVMRLYRQLHVNDPLLEERAARKVFDEILSSPMLHLMVLEHEGAVAAAAYLNIIPNLTRSAAPYAVIENVVVDEALRGTGLGPETAPFAGVIDRRARACAGDREGDRSRPRGARAPRRSHRPG